ncbi:SPOSA6832_04485, partial [Sporobolomyces salmonicolor]
MLHVWDGPLSAAIYLTEAADIAQLEAYLSSPDRSARWDQVALTIVKPGYSINEEALLARLRYPINRLRNLALSLSPTPYVLVVDVDFVPSPNMHFLLSSRGVPLLNRPSSRNSLSPTFRRTAVVIPTFALVPSFNGSFPSTPAELASLLTSTPPLATLTDPNAGHASPDPSHSYEICYEPQWEPYYLLARSSHPLYDERFTDQGGDKQAHALLLNALGYSFHVLRDVWVLHPPKTDKRDEAWPAARLVPERGRAERSAQEADEGGGEHFNLVAQRDPSRYRYFQDFLPEMERHWGANVRWPRGCSARIAAGRRNFGRARAATPFGL